MGQTDIISKTIVLGEFTEGSDGSPTGDYFVAVLTPDGRGGRGQWTLTPWSSGQARDNIIVGHILLEIARQNAFEGKDSKKKALDLLALAGEEGIALDLPVDQWKSIERVSAKEEMDFYIEGERFVPRLER